MYLLNFISIVLDEVKAISKINNIATFWIAALGGFIGLLGFVLSLISLSRHRRKITVNLIATRLGGREYQYIYCDMIISNISLSPVSITNIDLLDLDSKIFPCSFHINLVSHMENGLREIKHEVFTSVPPKTIGPFSSFRGIFAFKLTLNQKSLTLKNNYSKKEVWKFSLTTSRGKHTLSAIPPMKKDVRNPFPFPNR